MFGIDQGVEDDEDEGFEVSRSPTRTAQVPADAVRIFTFISHISDLMSIAYSQSSSTTSDSCQANSCQWLFFTQVKLI